MNPARAFVKRVNTRYCGAVLGQTQDVDACGNSVRLSVRQVGPRVRRLCRQGCPRRRGFWREWRPPRGSRSAWRSRTGSSHWRATGRNQRGSDRWRPGTGLREFAPRPRPPAARALSEALGRQGRSRRTARRVVGRFRSAGAGASVRGAGGAGGGARGPWNRGTRRLLGERTERRQSFGGNRLERRAAAAPAHRAAPRAPSRSFSPADAAACRERRDRTEGLAVVLYPTRSRVVFHHACGRRT